MKDSEIILGEFDISQGARTDRKPDPSLVGPKQFPVQFRYQMPTHNVLLWDCVQRKCLAHRWLAHGHITYIPTCIESKPPTSTRNSPRGITISNTAIHRRRPILIRILSLGHPSRGRPREIGWSNAWLDVMETHSRKRASPSGCLMYTKIWMSKQSLAAWMAKLSLFHRSEPSISRLN